MRGAAGLIGVFLGVVSSTAVEPTVADKRRECHLVPSYVFYAVSGDTEEEVLASMRRYGPKDDRGKSRFALADWDVAWDWKLDTRKGVDLSTVKITCSGVITLPKLAVAQTTPQELVKSWNTFVERLRDHELRHLQHATHRAPEIMRRLTEAHSASQYLSPRSANTIAERLIGEIKSLDLSYDAWTNHGKTEGTWGINPARMIFERNHSL